VAISRPSEVFELKTLAQPSRDSIKTRPKAVDRLIADLPKADPNQFARKIYDILREINSLNIPDKDRLYICQALHEPVNESTNYFKRHFITDALPLSSKNRVLAEAAVSLNLEMAISHKIMLNSIMQSPVTVFNRKNAREKLGMTVYYLARVLLLCFQNYVDHPSQTWFTLHGLYIWAEQQELLDGDFQVSKKDKKLYTVDLLYKQVLLMALLPPFRLRQRLIDKLFTLAEEWSTYTKILSAEEYKQNYDHVLIRMNSDSTPGFYLSEKAYQREQTRVLDLGPLVHLLREQIMHQAVAENDIKFVDIPDDTLKLLLATWGGESTRNAERLASNHKLNVSVGISATCALIHTLRREKEEIKDKTEEPPQPRYLELADTVKISPREKNENEPAMELALEELDNANTNLNVKVYKQDNADPWIQQVSHQTKSVNYDYDIKDWLNKRSASQSANSDSTSYTFDNVNESELGYCLLTHVRYGQQSGKMQIGEIVGMYDADTKGIHAVSVGVIRRIKHQDSVLELGIQKLAAYSSAVEIAQYHPQAISRKFIDSLMLPASKNTKLPITLLTQQKFKNGDQIVIRKNSNLTLVGLKDCVESTGIVSQFTFDILKDLGKEDIDPSNRAKFQSAWSLI